MIVKLAEDACKLLDELDELEHARANAGDIQATLKELVDINSKAARLHELCLLLRNRLPLKDLLAEELPKILKSLQDSHMKFAHEQERRQVRSLRDIASQLQIVLTTIQTRWKKYAESQVTPHFELLEMVRLLPEVRVQEAMLYGLKSRLQKHVAILPQTHAELAEFDNAFAQLRSRLANLESLHPEVKNFLRKVYDHEATIADLTDSVIQWCRQGEHSKIFRIDFIQ